MHNLHGEFETETIGKLLLFSGRGPWNDETMRNGVVKMSKLISNFDINLPWAQLSCLYGESLMPPSTFEIFIKQTIIRKQRGLSFLAIVIKDTDIARTIRSQLSYCYDAAGVEHVFVDTVEEAIASLSQNGFAFDSANVTHFFKQHDFTSR
ncbi:hypothetical protein [Alteromonas sp. A079]|uniref:hypothetical protein n=1 Tax=Alteromonas sp. A079 TaxID=3410268 RepID=UPI003BA1C054